MPLLDFGRLRPKGEIGMNYEQEKQAALNLKANAEERGFNIEGSHIRLINYVTGEVRECISDNWHNNVRTIKRCIHEDIDWCSAAGYPNVLGVESNSPAINKFLEDYIQKILSRRGNVQ